MQILKDKDIVNHILNSNKKVFLWGCSETTKKLLSLPQLATTIIQGIIDNNPMEVKDAFFVNYVIYDVTFLTHLDNAYLVIHGNHCRTIFEQLKSLNIDNNKVEIVFDYDNGAQKLFNKNLYINTDYNSLNKLTNLAQIPHLSTLDEQKFLNHGGDILINFNEAKNIFPIEQLAQAHITFLNKYTNNTKIYIGCGEDYREDYLHCDKRELPHIDIVCNAWEINTKISNLSTIYSRHMLEHLTHKEAELTLKNWYEALQKNGYIEVIVPNFDLRAEQWLSCEWELNVAPTEDEAWSVAGCWGWQRECDPLQENYNQSYWDVHKSGYNEKRITKILTHIGFNDIATKVDEKNNLIALAYKR